MRRCEFIRYKRRLIKAMRGALLRGRSSILLEAAFPAYVSRNPLISFIFWERIRRVIGFVESLKMDGAALDFGCGCGVMLPILRKHYETVVALDSTLEPIRAIGKELDLNGIAVDTADKLHTLCPKTFDIVLGLDVLEHIDDVDVDVVISKLCNLLVANGCLIVSGPTENMAYKMGRRIGGKEYSGTYHKRSIYEVEEKMRKHCDVRTIAVLFRPLPLFKIVCGVPRS